MGRAGASGSSSCQEGWRSWLLVHRTVASRSPSLGECQGCSVSLVSSAFCSQSPSPHVCPVARSRVQSRRSALVCSSGCLCRGQAGLGATSPAGSSTGRSPFVRRRLSVLSL